MPGFELHVGVDAEHLKKFQNMYNTQRSSHTRDLSPCTE